MLIQNDKGTDKIMEIEIKKLTPELADEYVHFFDVTQHDDKIDDHKCYCICWVSDDYEGKDFSTREKRRTYAKKYVQEKHLQGYLAYFQNEIVGWCNANTKTDCLQCACWRMMMNHVPLDDVKEQVKVKAIFCFMIAPHIQRKGVASKLLERVIEDAKADGFDYIEAYPFIDNGTFSSDFGGYGEMYERFGFEKSIDAKQGKVLRRSLK